jgi:hypothetical protein
MAAFQGNGADRTNLNTGKAPLTRKPFNILFTIKADYCIKPSFSKGHGRLPMFFLADKDAFAA